MGTEYIPPIPPQYLEFTGNPLMVPCSYCGSAAGEPCTIAPLLAGEPRRVMRYLRGHPSRLEAAGARAIPDAKP